MCTKPSMIHKRLSYMHGSVKRYKTDRISSNFFCNLFVILVKRKQLLLCREIYTPKAGMLYWGRCKSPVYFCCASFPEHLCEYSRRCSTHQRIINNHYFL